MIFLASSAGVDAGFVLLYPGFDSVELGSVWTLHDLYVKPETRRQGIGRLLMNKAKEFCSGKERTG